MNSVTGSCSPSVLIVPAMLSFSRIGRKSCTKSEVYGGAITSSTYEIREQEKTGLHCGCYCCFGGNNFILKHTENKIATQKKKKKIIKKGITKWKIIFIIVITLFFSIFLTVSFLIFGA